MFSVMYVCQSARQRGVPCEHYPRCIGPHQLPPDDSTSGAHVAITHGALDLTIQGHLPPPGTGPPLPMDIFKFKNYTLTIILF